MLPLPDGAQAGTNEGAEIENTGANILTLEDGAYFSESHPEKSNRAPASSDQDDLKWRRLRRPPSLESDYVSPRTKKEIEIAGWGRNITSLTPSNEILDTLVAPSFALQRKHIVPQALDRSQEWEPTLVLDGLHLRNIQRLYLRLLDISRGCANPPVANEERASFITPPVP
jgi:hypothetical protein